MLEKCIEHNLVLVQQKIEQIYEITKTSPNIEVGDVLDGYAGVFLFKNLFESKYNFKRTNFNPDKLISEIDNFGLGFSGQIWVNIFCNKDSKYIYEEYLEYIKTSALTDFSNNHYNLIYGGIGKLICLIESGVSQKYLNLITIRILENSNIYDEKIVWFNKYYPHRESKEDEINISMIQGLASILMSLTILYPLVSNNIKKQISKSLLSCVEWIKSIQLSAIDDCKMFPTHYFSKSDNHIYYNRIGWCYGDIGVAYSIYKAGLTIQCLNTKNYGLQLCEQIAEFKNTNLKYATDASFSQGTSGVAHIFNRLYKETESSKFDEARYYWLNETLKMSKHKDGLAGYKSWVDEKTGFESNYGLFDGISGIGLVLLGFLTDDVEDLNWDRCLLLS